MCLRLRIMNICGYRYLYLYLLYLFPSSTYLTYLYFLTSSTSSNLITSTSSTSTSTSYTKPQHTPKAVDSSSTIYLHLPYIYEYLTSNSILPRCNNTHQQVTAHAHNELRRYSWLKTFLLIL